jgi:hypothetical protein
MNRDEPAAISTDVASLEQVILPSGTYGSHVVSARWKNTGFRIGSQQVSR